MKQVPGTLRHSLVCKDHMIFDVLPCPWPDCSNGCSGEQFELIDEITGRSEVFSRREWKSPSGGVYYSWDGTSLPNWFAVDKVVWNEARRQGIIHENHRDTVYHYTSLSGMKGIIDTHCVWLSDYSHLDDTRELRYGIEVISGIALEMLASPEHALTQELIQAWVTGIRELSHRVCIASFSGDGDSLSQWRAYGNIAVGFDTKLPIGYVSETHFMPVEYDRLKQEALTRLYLCHMCQAYVMDNSFGRLRRLADVYHKTDKLIRLTTFFKDASFRDEAEYRIAYIEDRTLFESLGQKIAPKQFRVSQGKLIPYVRSIDLPMADKKQGKLNIRSVTLGPGVDDSLEQSLREYLAYNGYENVLVKRSGIPYRS